MSFTTITNEIEWQAFFKDLPDFIGKVYYSYSYLNALQANNEGIPYAHLYKSSNSYIFYPFLLKQVPSLSKKDSSELFDIESPYGYGGPVFINTTSDEEAAFFEYHQNWAKQNNIIAEFVRLSPFTQDSDALTAFYKPQVNRTTVYMPLTESFETSLNLCTSARKRNYKKAIKSLYAEETTATEQNIDIFLQLYADNMTRLNAEKYYFFSKDYFRALIKMPSKQLGLIFIKLQNTDKVIAAGLFLQDKLSMHYHLGASNYAYKDLQPSAFLLLSAAKLAIKQELKLFHLGCGLSNNDNDLLFRFKTGFSPYTLDFEIGKKIHNAEIYQELSLAWQKRTKLKPDILLHYHQ